MPKVPMPDLKESQGLMPIMTPLSRPDLSKPGERYPSVKQCSAARLGTGAESDQAFVAGVMCLSDWCDIRGGRALVGGALDCCAHTVTPCRIGKIATHFWAKRQLERNLLKWS